jgi:cytoskeletal protein RodZ
MSEEPEVIEEDYAAPVPEPEVVLGPGERLRAAREASGMSLEQVAAETRIPQRHLVLIEAGDFAALPARTYAIGFSKNFAKAVGLDEEEIGEDVRGELAGLDAPTSRIATFEPGDPARVPGGNILWVAIGAVALLLVVGYFSYNSLFAPQAELPSLLPEEQPTPPAAKARPSAGPAQPAASGPVVFTALEDGVWVKFYDASGAQLMQKQMARGETYTVPATAQGPQLWTGRPDALAITIGGRQVPRLATAEGLMKDVPVTAAALLARRPVAASPIPTAVSTPAASAARPPAATQPRAQAPRQQAPRPAPQPVESAIAAAANSAAAPTD